MAERSPSLEIGSTREVADAVTALKILGKCTIDFSRIVRAPRFPDGRKESDVEHSFQLSLSAPELAFALGLPLDLGLLSQFATVHDLAEKLTGDVWTFNITEENRAIKKARDAIGTEEMIARLPPLTGELLRRYEEQIEPEARFVCYTDKIMPAIINMFDDPRTSTFLEDHKVTSAEYLREHREESAIRLAQIYPEFPSVHEVKRLISEQSADHYFPSA